MYSTTDDTSHQSDRRALSRAILLVLGVVVSALQPPRLLLGILAIACMAVGGSFIDAVAGSQWMSDQSGLTLTDEPFDQSEFDAAVSELEAFHAQRLAETVDPEKRAALEAFYESKMTQLMPTRRMGPFEAAALATGEALSLGVMLVVEGSPLQAFRSLKVILFEIPATLWHGDPLMTSLIALMLGFFFALFGGAISRLDALDTGLGRKPTAWDGLEFAWANIGRLIGAVLLPLLIVLFLSGLLALVGIPFNLPVLDVIGGILYAIPLALGLICSILLLGYAVLAPVLLGAVAVERADAGEAIQGAWGALFAKPGHFLLLMVIAILGFSVSLAVVDSVAVLAMDLAATSWGGFYEGDATRMAGGFEPLDFTFQPPTGMTTGTASAADAFIGFWETVVVAAVLGYIFSWTASIGTRLFLGMRLIADRQSPSVIWQPGTVGGTTIRSNEHPEAGFESNDHYTEGVRTRSDGETNSDPDSA